MAAGPIPPNPATLLGSTAFKDAIGYLRDEFQHIIIDTPPTMSLPDSRVISSMADAVILVLRHNYTPRETARMTRQMLTQVHADIIGVILNQVSYQKRGYGGYYYRKYHYYYYSSEGRKSS
jgi:capsular exopolysaccharide synthesis family protein